MNNSNTNKIKNQAVKSQQIFPIDFVKAVHQGDKHCDILWKARDLPAPTKRLDKHTYMVKRTGEIKEYEEGLAVGGKHINNLRRTFAELKYLIRSNFDSSNKWQKFVTLTYGHDGYRNKDPKLLYKDFKHFMQALRRGFPGHEFTYISVAEPQGDGTWHLHIMIKSGQPKWWFDKELCNKYWPHGMTKVEQLKSDDVGQYYIAYFTDLETEYHSHQGGHKTKAQIKGSRLRYYPRGFKFYRASRNIVRPVVEMAQYDEVLSDYGEPKFTKSIKLTMVDGDKFINKFQREYFRKD